MNSRKLSILSLICIGSFLFFGILGIQQYPGGSDSEPGSQSFQWLYNYWCDLYAPTTYNGETNAARPWAMLATGLLSVGFILAWLSIPSLFPLSRWRAQIRVLPGISGTALTVFLFSPWHDQIINFAGALLGLSIVALCPPLYRHGYTKYSFWGGLSVFIGAITYIVYQSGLMPGFLPLLQKIAMVIFTGWMVGMNVAVLRMEGIEKTGGPNPPAHAASSGL
jgi:hypothetical protein